MIKEDRVKKGDVLSVARVAGIMAAKRTYELIPLCHPLQINAVEVDFELDEEASCVEIHTSVKTSGRTGVEIEALTAASVAGLTIYDMCKAVDRAMTVSNIQLVSKSGGRSGNFRRQDRRPPRRRDDTWAEGTVIAVCTSTEKHVQKDDVGSALLVEELGPGG